MAYEKQAWVNGETVVDQTRMEHIEDGVEAAHATADALEAAQAAQPLVQSGTVVVTVEANTNSSAPVTFPVPFSSQPVVVVTPSTGVPERIESTGVSNVSTTGCVVTMFRTTSVNTTMQWIAVGAR